MQAYVINLNARTDRWGSVQRQWEKQDIPLTRIEAIESNSISLDKRIFLPAPVVANWHSQKLVFSEFLATSESFALVFEDDFLIRNTNLQKIAMKFEAHEFDFLQLGFLRNSYLDYLNVLITNLRDLFLKLLNRASNNFGVLRSFSRRLLVAEQTRVPFSIVLNDARAGSHAYLISRKFAETMLSVNEPAFLATDGLFIAIANLRFLKMGRMRSNLIRQSNSPSSITSRFIEN